MHSEALIKDWKNLQSIRGWCLTAPWILLNLEIFCKTVKQMTQNSLKVKLQEEIKIHYSYLKYILSVE